MDSQGAGSGLQVNQPDEPNFLPPYLHSNGALSCRWCDQLIPGVTSWSHLNQCRARNFIRTVSLSRISQTAQTFMMRVRERPRPGRLIGETEKEQEEAREEKC